MHKFDMMIGYGAVQKESKQLKGACKIIPVTL